MSPLCERRWKVCTMKNSSTEGRPIEEERVLHHFYFDLWCFFMFSLFERIFIYDDKNKMTNTNEVFIFFLGVHTPEIKWGEKKSRTSWKRKNQQIFLFVTSSKKQESLSSSKLHSKEGKTHLNQRYPLTKIGRRRKGIFFFFDLSSYTFSHILFSFGFLLSTHSLRPSYSLSLNSFQFSKLLSTDRYVSVSSYLSLKTCDFASSQTSIHMIISLSLSIHLYCVWLLLCISVSI